MEQVRVIESKSVVAASIQGTVRISLPREMLDDCIIARWILRECWGDINHKRPRVNHILRGDWQGGHIEALDGAFDDDLCCIPNHCDLIVVDVNLVNCLRNSEYYWCTWCGNL